MAEVGNIKVPMAGVGELTATITLTGCCAWRIRLWLVVQCFRLADLLAPKNVHVKVDGAFE